MNSALDTNAQSILGPLEIAHVLFIDIVSYSVLPTDKQLQIIQQLQKLVRLSLPDVEQGLPSEQVISLPTGDGLALAFFRDPIAPLRCARQISILLEILPFIEFAVRMGLHSGPIYRHADINASANLAGSGINLAQRVMDCGDGGHILASKSVADVLMQLSEWKGAVHELGVIEVKHGVRIEISNIFDESFGNPSAPSKFQSAPAKSQHEATKVVSERAFDVAIGREVPVNLTTELVALIRELRSQGLKGILGTDPDFTVAPEDVRSKPLTLEFPVDRAGIPLPLDLTIKVTSPDFEPTSQSRCIRIPPFRDSDICTFLLTPRQLGELKVNVELYSGDVALFSRLLKTCAMTSDRLPRELSQAILTIPLTVVVQPSPSGPIPSDRTKRIGNRFAVNDIVKHIFLERRQALAEAFPEFPDTFEVITASRVDCIPLSPTERFIWAGTVQDENLFKNSQFYLAINANMGVPDIIQKVLQFLKMAAPDDLDRVIRSALGGIGLRHIPVVPAAIPMKLNNQYFQLYQNGPLWNRFVSSRRIAVYAPAEIIDPKIEMIAVRE